MVEKKPHAIYFEDKSRTKQQFKDECSLKEMVKRFQSGRSRGLTSNILSPMYGDVSNVGSFQDCCNVITKAKEEFLTLPSDVRDRFRNNPSELVEFMADENNREEAIRLGLVEKPKIVPKETPPAEDGGAQGGTPPVE